MKKTAKRAAAKPAPIEPPPTIPAGQRLYILDVPFNERAIASANGARWHAGMRATIYVGSTLPHGLSLYESKPFSWERWIEDDANDTAGAVPPAQHSLIPRPHQKEGADAIVRAAKAGARGFLLADQVGVGKAQPLDSLVLTPSGFKEMGRMAVGDDVTTPSGDTAKVIGVYPQGKRPVYRVIFSDKTFVKCDEDHLWAVNTTTRNSLGNSHFIKTTKEILETVKISNGGSRWYVPMVSSNLNLTSTESLPVDPYLLGALLGDGGIKHALHFTSADQQMIDELTKLLPEGVTFIKVKGSEYDWRISRPIFYGKSIGNPLTNSLRILELMGHGAESKFIPKRYLYSSAATRLAILQGLMDTDGSVGKINAHLEFGTSSEQLAKDVTFLVQSLGGWTRTTTRIPWYSYKGEKKKGRQAWRLSISLPPEVVPFRLKRKLDLHRPKTKYPPIRAIRKVEYIGEEETQCIMIDSPDHLYITDNFTVTHNTITAASAVLELKKTRPVTNLLIVCPLAVVPHWRRTIADMGFSQHGIRVCVINYHRLKKLLEVPASAQAAKRTATKNRQTARKGTSLVKWDVVLSDESHNLRHRTSQRSQAFSRVASYDKPREDSPFICWMSATGGQTPLELSYLTPMLAQATKSSGSSLKDWGEWLLAQGYHVTHEPRFDQWVWTEEPKYREADIKKIYETLFTRRTPLALRRVPSDIAGWPEIQRILYPAELDIVQTRLYEQAWTEFRREMKLAQRGKDSKAGFVAKLRFRQKASLIRVDGTVEHALDLLANGHQVVISCEFLETLDTIKEQLEKNKVAVAVMDGRNPGDREMQRLNFQTGKATVCLFTPTEGFSLHQNEQLENGQYATNVPRSLIIHDPRYSGIANLQIEGRSHRDGMNAIAYYMYGEGTVEENIVKVLLSRIETTQAMVGDDVSTVKALEAILTGDVSSTA